MKKLSTVVITGPTDGIGKVYAFELAKLGVKRLVLVARNPEKLNQVAKQITEKHPSVKIGIIIADFERTDIYEDIESKIKEYDDIEMLINNVGANINAQTLFHLTKSQNLFKMININIISVVMMSHIVLKQMIACNRKGTIVNISSAWTKFYPFQTMYASSKTFMSRFSCSLRLLYQPMGFTIQEFEPLFVSTKMARFVKNWLTISPEIFVDASLKELGHYGRCHGHPKHMLQGFVLSHLPLCMQRLLSQKTGRQFKSAAVAQLPVIGDTTLISVPS